MEISIYGTSWRVVEVHDTSPPYDLCCMSSLPFRWSGLSLPAVVVQQSGNATKNHLKKKRNKTTTENYPWQVSEVLQKCLTSHFNFISPSTPVSQSSMVLWRQSIDLREQLEAAVMWSVACYIVQISKAHIWYPGRGGGVKSWHINWTECMHVTKMTLSRSAESH